VLEETKLRLTQPSLVELGLGLSLAILELITKTEKCNIQPSIIKTNETESVRFVHHIKLQCANLQNKS
jgi:hypothetical protein